MTHWPAVPRFDSESLLGRLAQAVDRRPGTVAAGLAALTAVLYVGFAWTHHHHEQLPVELPLPLDDSWIHQVFARNLSERAELAFNSGEPSNGTTSLLWVLLLTPGHWLGIPVPWAYGVGAASFAGVGALVYRITRATTDDGPLPACAALTVVSTDWHLAWASVSGMETCLLCAWLLAGFHAWILGRSGVRMGLWFGLAFWTRMEAALFFVPMLAANCFVKRAPRSTASALATFAVVVLPWFLVHWSVAGDLVPSTLAAKEAFVAPYLPAVRSRYLLMFIPATLSYLTLILLPCVPWALTRSVPHHVELRALGTGSVLLVAAYAIKLPLLLAYARYLMPVIPVVAILGVVGAASLLRGRWPLLRRCAPAILLIGAIRSWTFGLDSFQESTRAITKIHVQSALWLREHTEPGELVATHDIGALGYFSHNRVFDTAGLITPEAVPLIREPRRLVDAVLTLPIRYLAQVEDWYVETQARLAGHSVARFSAEPTSTELLPLVVYDVTALRAPRSTGP